MNATIKSGTNEYHGSAFEFLRNDKLDANSFVADFARQPRAKFRQNQFGGAFGGPVRAPRYNGRNRTFFFLDYEGARIRQVSGSSLLDVPSDAFRKGDLSSSTTPAYDPAFLPMPWLAWPRRCSEPSTGLIAARRAHRGSQSWL